MRDRARLVDALLKTAWTLHVGEHVRELALIAVGGYGRGELTCAPTSTSWCCCRRARPRRGSRISSASSRSCGTSASKSATACARSTTASARALADVSVATTLIEARLLVGPGAAVRSDAPRARARARLADARFLRSQGRRADRAPSPLPRHRLQPRAEREVEPRRAARHPDDRLGREAPLRRRLAR